MPIYNGLLVSNSLQSHVIACVNNGKTLVAIKDIKNELNISLKEAAGVFNSMHITGAKFIRGGIDENTIIQQDILPEDAFLYG